VISLLPATGSFADASAAHYSRCEFTGDVEIVRVAIGIVLLLLVPSVAAAEPRIALIITNQAYTQAGASLTNTHRDSELVKGALEKVGFKTRVVRTLAMSTRSCRR
jgi:hypothetical protein